MLFRNKSYSAINIAGLSLGLACAMLIILYTKDELSFDRFHSNSSRIYRIVRSSSVTPEGNVDNRGGSTGLFQGPKFTAGIPEIQEFVRYNSTQKELKQKSEILDREVFVADPSFFSVFSFPLLSGNPVNALKEPNSVVISKDMAKEHC